MRKFYGYFIAIYFCLATAAVLPARPDINLSLSQNSWLTPEIFRCLVLWMGAEDKNRLCSPDGLRLPLRWLSISSMSSNEQH